MGRIILPGHTCVEEDVPDHIVDNNVTTIRVQPLPAPQHLKEDLEANPKLLPLYREAMGKALSYVLNIDKVKPRVVTGAILKELQQKCHDALIMMRYDLKWPLRRCFDLLPEYMVGSLERGERAEDLADAKKEDHMWRRNKDEEEATIAEEDPHELLSKEVTSELDEGITEAEKATKELLPNDDAAESS